MDRKVVINDHTKHNIHKRDSRKVYREDVLRILKKFWRISGFVSSKYLNTVIRLNHEVLLKFGGY
jgi:hypothetical protein